MSRANFRGALLAFLFSASPAFGQVINPGVQQSGAVTAGHAVSWGPGTGQIQDGGVLPTPPAGSVGSYQFNNSGALGGSTSLSNSGSTDTESGIFNLTGTFQKSGNAITFPGVADTLAAWGIANSFTGNNSFAGTSLFTGAAFTVAVNGQATIGGDATNGAVVKGQGLTNDLSLMNKNGTSVCRVATGTLGLSCAGNVVGTSFQPTGAAAPVNGFYLPAANTPAISANSIESQSWTSTGTTFFGTIIANALGTGTIDHGLCATATGQIVPAAAGANCIGGAVTSLSQGAGITLTPNPITTTGTIALSLGNATLEATPANPTSTVSTTGVMMGLGTTCKLTPVYSTRIQLQFIGNGQNGGITATTTVKVFFGTGTAPVNGAASAGTQVGASQAINENGTANISVPFANGGIITGLTPGTAYWFDLNVATSNASFAAALVNMSCNALEF